MTLGIGVLIVALCLVLAAVVFVGHMIDSSRDAEDPIPDGPTAFGHETCWLAIRTAHTIDVVESLKLAGPRLANWKQGLNAVQGQRTADTEVFVSPPVDGWTFVIGLALPQPMGPAFEDKVRPLLARLGRRFPDVQYFLNFPTFDYFSWQRLRDGKFVRAFAATDEGVVMNKGVPTAEERSLGLKLFELRGVRDRHGDAGGELLLHPTEAHVLTLARTWSLDPTRISDAMMFEGLGYLGSAPAAWKAQRAGSRSTNAA